MSMSDTPIQRKLMRIMLLTSTIVLLLTCVAFFAYEFVSFRKDTVQHLSTLGKIIAANSTAALVFGNQADAVEILNALSAEKHIVAACLYDNTGKLFSQYPENSPIEIYPAAPGLEGYRFEDGHLAGFEPVLQGEKHFGTLYLQSDMGAMYERIKLHSVIVLMVLMVSLLVAYGLSRTLQKQISRPILELAETAKAISERRDYSVRAAKGADDELGILTDAFNHMLSQIQDQDKSLRENEERFRLMVANVQDYAIIMLNPVGQIITWNAGAENILGYNSKEILNEHFSRFYPSDELLAGEPDRKLKATVSRGRLEYEGWRVRKDGTRFCANIVVTALWAQSGQLRGFCKVTRDITERKRAEDEIRKLNADLEQRLNKQAAELRRATSSLESEMSDKKN